MDVDCGYRSGWRQIRSRSGFRARSSRRSRGIVHLVILFGTGTLGMVRSSGSGGALWAFGTSRTAPRSPWQDPYVERLIGTIRRECLDHMIVFGEAHLRRILGRYAAYYNES